MFCFAFFFHFFASFVIADLNVLNLQRIIQQQAAQIKILVQESQRLYQSNNMMRKNIQEQQTKLERWEEYLKTMHQEAASLLIDKERAIDEQYQQIQTLNRERASVQKDNESLRADLQNCRIQMKIYDSNKTPDHDQCEIANIVKEKDREIAEITARIEKREDQLTKAIEKLRSLKEKYEFLWNEHRENKRQLNFVMTLGMKMYKHLEFFRDGYYSFLNGNQESDTANVNEMKLEVLDVLPYKTHSRLKKNDFTETKNSFIQENINCDDSEESDGASEINIEDFDWFSYTRDSFLQEYGSTDANTGFIQENHYRASTEKPDCTINLGEKKKVGKRKSYFRSRDKFLASPDSLYSTILPK